jgi:hypothetical protein
MDFQEISKIAFLDELQKIASIGSTAKMWMMEAKGFLPKGTSVAESSRGSQALKNLVKGQTSTRPSVSSSQLAKPFIPSTKF